ncbi:MAG TPA: transcription antitermination factor NusB [Labilithrix sp.]|jgi:N utilization substance protein B|nr:transcription antitermination factor NusB [Labilithrix sp.]
MGARRSGREAALQMLFQLEASGASAARTIELFWRASTDVDFEPDPEGRSYADTLVRGVADNLADVDKRITQASQNWRLERMGRVDRNLLRMGTWELMAMKDVPRAVVIDEAVELAKTYGTEDSSSFVNGVLDRIATNLGRTDDDRAGDTSSKAKGGGKGNG